MFYGNATLAVIAVSDFDGDGRSDILWENPTTGAMLLWLMNGVTPSGTSMTTIAPAGAHLIAVGDYNNDDEADLVWADSSGAITIQFMHSWTLLATQHYDAQPSGWSVALAN